MSAIPRQLPKRISSSTSEPGKDRLPWCVSELFTGTAAPAQCPDQSLMGNATLLHPSTHIHFPLIRYVTIMPFFSPSLSLMPIFLHPYLLLPLSCTCYLCFHLSLSPFWLSLLAIFEGRRKFLWSPTLSLECNGGEKIYSQSCMKQNFLNFHYDLSLQFLPRQKKFMIYIGINIFLFLMHFFIFSSGIKVLCLAISRDQDLRSAKALFRVGLKLHPWSHLSFDLSLPLLEGWSVSSVAILAIKGNGSREEHLSDIWVIKNTSRPLRPPLP